MATLNNHVYQTAGDGPADDPFSIKGTQYTDRNIWQAPDAAGNINYQSGQSGFTRDDVQSFFDNLAQTTGAPINEGDIDGLLRKLEGGSDYIAAQGGDPNRAFDEYRRQYEMRASNTPGEGGGGGDQQSVAQQWNAQTSAPPPAAPDPFLAMLMERIQGGMPDRNDPNVRAQADAFSANTERARRNYLSDTAERSGPFANLQGERRMAAERSGIASGAFEAQLVGREIQAKRDEIAQALALYGNRLSDVDRMALQRELADLEASLRREGFGVNMYGLGLNNDQFLRSLAQRQYEFDSTLPFI